MLFNLFTGLMGLPKRNGKLKDLSKFDADFFGVHHKQAMYMDPQLRIMLELSFEAMIDAGKYFLLSLSIFHLFTGKFRF